MFVWQNELRADFGSVYITILSLNLEFPKRLPIEPENKRDPAAGAAAVLTVEGSFCLQTNCNHSDA